jgi:phage baseplate assembly protein gpV
MFRLRSAVVGSLAVVTILLVSAGTASATSLTSPTGWVVTPTIKAASEGFVTLDLAELPKIECESKVEGTVSSHGAGKAASGNIGSLSFTNCKNGWHVTASSAGSLSVKWTSGYNGDVFSTGATIEATRSGVICRYSTNNTTVGTLTGGKPATMHISASIPFHNGSIVCGSGATAWTGSYKVTGPEALYVDEELSHELGTSITSPTGTVATPTIKVESEGHVVLDNPIAKIECSSTVEGKVESHGETVPATGNFSTLSITGCTDSWHVTVVTAGSLLVDHVSGYKGTVFANGATVEATRFGITCRYASEITDIGTLTGGKPATLSISAAIPFHSGSIFCGTAPTAWTGSYKVTSPASLYVDEETELGPGTSITSPTGTVATPTIKAESEGHVVLDNPIAKIECSSTVEGKVESHGEAIPAAGTLSGLSFTGCTNDWHVTVISAGELAASWDSDYDGTVFSTGATVEATRFGISCRYRTEASHIGRVTGGTPATLDISAAIPFHSGSIFCGTEPTAWTGSYEVTSPGSLFVDDAVPGTSLTAPTGTVATPTIKAESEGHVSLDHPIAKIQCQWAFEGTVEAHDSDAVEVPLSSVTTNGCTEEWHVTTVSPGELEIEGTSGYDGKVTWTGGTIEMTRLGTTCRYKSESTQIGTITGGSPATIDIEGKLPFHSGSPLCGTEAYPLTGSYKVTSPSGLYVDKAV